MTIIYVHGVKVRDPRHGVELGRSFDRWLRPKLSVGGAAPGYEPVFWGDLAATFAWDLRSRPPTRLLGMGGEDDLAGLGSLRGVGGDTIFDRLEPVNGGPGPVLGGNAVIAALSAPPLALIPVERRGDLLADLYLACLPARDREDPVVDEPTLAGLAAAHRSSRSAGTSSSAARPPRMHAPAG